jgi:hypothetical protein
MENFELLTANIIALNRLKSTALELAIKKVNPELFEEFEKQFEELKSTDEGWKNLTRLVQETII